MGNDLQVTKQGKNKFYDGVKLTTAYQFFEESQDQSEFSSCRPNGLPPREKVDALTVSLDFENKKIGDLRLYYGAEYMFNKVHSEGSQTNITTGVVSAAAFSDIPMGPLGRPLPAT